MDLRFNDYYTHLYYESSAYVYELLKEEMNDEGWNLNEKENFRN